jgi:hypothetical protein
MSTLAKRRIIDPVLTELARGYSNSSLVGTNLFPIVEVEKEGGKIPQFTKEAFKIYNTERAIRARSNRISPEIYTSIDFVMAEHDLEYPMDYREVEENITPLKLHAANVVSEGISIRLEKLIADLAQNLSTYPTGNKVTLSAGSKFDEDVSNPFLIIDTALEAVRSKIGKRPNLCLMGAATFKALKNHPKIHDRIKYSERSVVTTEMLAQLFGFDRVLVGDSVYSSDAGIFTDIWGDNLITAYVPQLKDQVDRTYYEPAFAYTLRKKGYPVIDSYEESGKVLILRNTDIFIPKVVGNEAAYLINDTNS